VKRKLFFFLDSFYYFFYIVPGLDNIVDKFNQWESNDQYSKLAQNLLKAEFQPARRNQELGVDVQVVDMGTSLGTESKYLITHEASRKVYDKALEDLDEALKSGLRCGAIIAGSPGIGKTFNLYYALKKLLHKNELVFFHLAKWKKVYMFYPLKTNFKVFVTSVPDLDYAFETSIRMNECRYPYLLYDPAENKPVNVMVTEFSQIIAISDKPSRFDNMDKDNIFRYYMRSYSLEELFCASEYLSVGSPLSDAEIEKRVFFVGTLARYIFNDQKYVERKKAIDVMCSSLSYDVIVSYLKSNGVNGDASLLLFDVTPVEDDNRSKKERDFVSSYVFDKLVSTCIAKMNDLMSTRNLYNEKAFGKIFERYFIQIPLGRNLQCQSRKLDYGVEKGETVKFKLGAANIKLEKIEGKNKGFLEFWRHNVKCSNILTFSDSDVLPVIDAMDQRSRGFQITTNKNHGIKGVGLIELLEVLGYIIVERNEKVNKKENEKESNNISEKESKKEIIIKKVLKKNEKTEEKYQIYFCVPSEEYEEFPLQKIDLSRCGENGQEKNDIKMVLESMIEQWCLKCDKESS
jgi:hypothetical protein